MTPTEQQKIKQSSTSGNSVSTRFDTDVSLGRWMIFLGAATAICSLALVLRTYFTCPFCDEWNVVGNIAGGKTSVGWLWSQHNEHRIVIPRLLIWLDWTVFGGRNISLLVEIWMAQSFNCVAICFVLERLTQFPVRLKRSMQGLFILCLFHPNQAENLTWPFQIGFVLPFTIATFAFLLISFFERVRLRKTAIAIVGLAPLLAGLGVAGGLLIGPVTVALAGFKRLRKGTVVTISSMFAVSALAYVVGYRTPPWHSSPLESIRCPFVLADYGLTYLGAPFDLPGAPFIGFASLVLLAVLGVQAARHGMGSDFEWFCWAECVFVVAMAVITGLGRLNFGVEQAYAGRYHTPTMLYWACVLSLAVIAFWRSWPDRPGNHRWILLPVCVWAFTVPFLWRMQAAASDTRRAACRAALSGHATAAQAEVLDHSDPELVTRDARYIAKRLSR